MTRRVSNDQVWWALRKKIGNLARSTVKVGILGPDSEDGDISIVEIGAIHEFGSPAANIPERSFIRRTFQMKTTKVAKFTARIARAIINDRLTADKALELLGLFGAAEVKKTITKGARIPPKLKPATIARKGSSRPLVDTGRLLNSVTHQVVKR